MFDNLTRRLSTTFAKLAGRTHLTDAMLDDAFVEIRAALLEADVALDTVKKIMAGIREKAIGQKIVEGTRPAETVAKIVYDELVEILGGQIAPSFGGGSAQRAVGEAEASVTSLPPASAAATPLQGRGESRPQIIMLVGLQGTGKTTTAGKLALYLSKMGRRVLLASTDIYRPSAREQLEMLAASAGVDSLPIISDETPIDIAKRALSYHLSPVTYHDIIIDTAGRLHIDEALMAELRDLKKIANPTDILLTVDAMAGQDSLNVAREFNAQLGITGLIMTRADGDARGGAVLSMRVETGAPVLFTGTGEKITDIEPFYPDRVASRILGMGDVVSLVEKAQEHISERDAEKMMTKMFSGEFNLNDMLDQMKQIKKMGSIGGILKLIPGMGAIGHALKDRATDDAILKQMAIIQSMTMAERSRPEIIFAARKNRIAAGSGTTVRDVEALLKNYEKMRGTMKQFSTFGNPDDLMKMMKDAPPETN